MTIEEKAKAYDEALKRAKAILKVADNRKESLDYVSTIFPELAQSEDEGIRKALLEMVHDTTGDELWVDYNVHKEEALAWLEKQESVREVVERCKNSWYNEGKIAGMAEGLTNDEKYQQGWHDALEKQCQTFTKKDVDDAYLKGICDAKHELEKQGNNTPTIIWHNIDEKPEEMKELFCEWESDDATWHDVAFYDEESHTFRHAKMPINVTKWVYVDELLEKQGEQKPVDKVEPFDKYEGLTDFERTLADICIGWIGEELGWKQYIKDNADVLLKIAIEMFNSIQDAPFEQKSAAWSDEDEKMYKIAFSCIETLEDISNGKNMHADVKEWLKSLKNRIGG